MGMTTTRRDDTDQIERDQGGDRAAFQQRIGPHHALALGLALRLLGNHDDAEDAVQEALLKTYQRREALDEVSDERSWLLRVVFNQCMDARRRRASRTRHEHAQLAASSSPSPEEGSARRDVLRRVREVLGELPPKQQAVLHLRVYEELDYASIGKALDLSPQSARVYLVKARAHLRQRLERELEER
jgi:RNA polymerase sigma-70 factor (ECF subfamily)